MPTLSEMSMQFELEDGDIKLVTFPSINNPGIVQLESTHEKYRKASIKLPGAYKFFEPQGWALIREGVCLLKYISGQFKQSKGE